MERVCKRQRPKNNKRRGTTTDMLVPTTVPNDGRWVPLLDQRVLWTLCVAQSVGIHPIRIVRCLERVVCSPLNNIVDVLLLGEQCAVGALVWCRGSGLCGGSSSGKLL